jgi:dihydroflavonol-4-reductase
MLGAFDVKPGPGAMIINHMQGKIPGYSKGGRNFVHVRDVAAGIISAIQNGKIGESYILGNQNLSYKEFFDLVSETTGVKKLKRKIPALLIKTIGAMGSVSGFLSGKAPKLSLPMTKVSCDTHYFTSSKAVKDLKMPQTPVKTAIEDAVKWFRENNYIS